MKGILDKELKIAITNKLASYDIQTDTLIFAEHSVTKNRKNGFLFYDKTGRNLGIVYKSDDKRTYRYGQAELLFFKRFKSEFGTWRVIKLNGQYLNYNKLLKILQENNEFICTTDSRLR